MEADLHPKLEAILDRLEGVRGGGIKFQARCPAHDDSNPSLGIRQGDKWINLHCMAGCSYDAIRQKLGLQWSDLVLDDQPAGKRKPKRRDWRAIELESYACAARLQHEPKVLERLRFGRGWAAKALETLVAGWDGHRITLPVRDATLKLHDVLRYDPFAQGGVRKILAGKGKSRLPWPPPEYVTSPDVLFVVEGEGTAISMTSVGLTAVALPGSVAKPATSVTRPGAWQGAGWHPKWAERFRRFRTVVCLPDCDQQGRALMRAAHYDMEKVGVNVKIVDIGPKTNDGTDIADHLLKQAWDSKSRLVARDVIRTMVAEEAEVFIA